jgi:fermentation-respiration switch protein FrsA (DUF1100 family)
MLSGCGPLRERARVLAHGCVDVPVPPATGVHVERGSFLSRFVPDAVRYAIVVPDGARHLDAVAYHLPGRAGDAESALALGMSGFHAAYLRAGGRKFALAIMDSGESYFHPRASGEDRLAVATREFPPIVRDVLGVKHLREAVMGQSMGGYGALLAAEREPRRYRAVAVAGPAIFPSYADERRSVGDAFDGAADFARYDVIAHAGALRGRPVRIRCGRNDPFVPGVRSFARACPTADVRVEPGCHDDGFWRSSATALLAFVGAHL